MSNNPNTPPNSYQESINRANSDHDKGYPAPNTHTWSQATREAYENQRTWREKQGK